MKNQVIKNRCKKSVFMKERAHNQIESPLGHESCQMFENRIQDKTKKKLTLKYAQRDQLKWENRSFLV